MIKRLLVFLFVSLGATTLFAQKYREMISVGTYSVYEIQKEAEQYFDTKGRGKGTGYKQYKRWEYFAFREADAQGYLSNSYDSYQELRKFQRREARKKRTTAGNNLNENGNWQELGPTYYNATSGWNPGVGRITSVAVDENNANHIIAGANTGGVWKTIDKGQTWTVLTDNFTTMNVGALAISPQNSSIYYWGGSSGYIYKSTDGGANWQQAGRAGFSTIIRVAIHPTNNNIMFAASEYSGIYRSTDGGDNWSKVTGDSRAYDIQFKPNDPNTVYASGSGFHKSTDAGANWTTISGVGSGVKMIGVSANDASRVYVLEASSDGTFGALYRSNNSGSSFSELNQSGKNYFGYSTTGSDTDGQAPRDMAIAVSPLDANEVHIAGILTWRSTNGGTSFSCTSDWTPGGANRNNIGYCHADVDMMLFYGSTLYVATDGGLFITENTANVTKDYYTDITTGMGIHQFYKIGVSQTEGILVTGGSQDNGTSVLKGTDPIWYSWLGGDGMESFVDWNNSNILYGTTQYGGMYKSTNGGQSRSDITSPDGKSGNWVTPFEQDPVNASTIYVGYDELYKSTNSGDSWTSISSSISFGGKLDEVKIARTNNQVIYASRGGNLFKTSNGGTNWTQLSGISGTINHISIHPSDPERIALAVTGNDRVLVSQDGGNNWSSYKLNLPNLSAYCVVWQEDANGLYVGMNYGIYYIDDNLTEWESFLTGIPNVRVNELEINATTGKIYAGSYGRGLWYSDLRGVQVTTNDLAIDKISEPQSEYCTSSTSYQPEVDIKNIGSDPITSAIIKVEFDGQVVQTYNFQGNLAFGEKETIFLNSIDNIGEGSHTIRVFSENPNGIADENTENDEKTVSFSVTNGKEVQLTLSFDQYPEETSWEITKDGQVIMSGDSYTERYATIKENLCFENGCYQFKIKDTFGDGMNEGDTKGSYRIVDLQTGETLVESTQPNFGTESTHDFCIELVSYDYDATVFDLEGSFSEVCQDSIYPTVVLQNLGELTLNTVDLKVFVDNQLIKTFNHTTSLAKNQQETITLDIPVTAALNGELKVVVENPNGQTDEVSDNDETSVQQISSIVGDPVRLTINFDNYPEEVSWSLSQNGTVVENFSHTATNTEDEAVYQKDFCLASDCYLFTMNDEFGDGFLDGGYSLVNMATNLTYVETEGDYGAIEETDFCIGGISVDFTTNKTTAEQCEEIVFTADVEGNASSYAWDFGDGQTATGVGPHTITYTTTGAKTVSLLVDGKEQETKTAFITVSEKSSLNVGVAVSLIEGDNPSCSGESLTFEPTGALGQNTTYVWSLNGDEISQLEQFTYQQFSDGDKVTVQATTDIECLANFTVTSTEYIVQRTSSVSPTIFIQTSDLPACEGDDITFVTDGVTNEGDNPTYIWSVNGISITTESNTSFTTSGLSDGDIVFCTLTSSEDCVTNAEVTSNTIVIDIDVCTDLVSQELEAVKVYPNPVEDKLSIDFGSLEGQEVSWKLLNTHGQILHTGNRTIETGFTHSIDMTTLPSGTYLIKISSNENTIVKKVEKK
ncbi:MAG: T9SS type A sorting domain-containing protein [Cytophagales bacterium]|nr:T9SS type A sorting domain-containing protein [Cytophagales bacterium]